MANIDNIEKNYPQDEHFSKPAFERTVGLKAFDVFLYPFLTNFVVFGISVAATYLTAAGGNRNTEGELIYGKVGEFFHSRGEWLTQKFEQAGMGHGTADMAKMVFFSFADGTLMAPVVKLLEDRREDIGKSIDDMLGTRPEDDSVYKAEPKQSWGSVLGGRLATVSIVVPTAVALSKIGLKDGNWIWNTIKDNEGFKSLNTILFEDPGHRLGNWADSIPAIKRNLRSFDIPALGKISAFEAFYTSVCTTGLYFSSRLLAGFGAESNNQQSHTTQLVNGYYGDKNPVISFNNNIHNNYPPSQISGILSADRMLQTERINNL